MSKIGIDRSNLIRRESWKLFYGLFPHALLATLLFSTLICLLYPGRWDDPVVSLSAALPFLFPMGWGLSRAWHRATPSQQMRRVWWFCLLPLVLFPGVGWGMITAFMLPLYQGDAGSLILLCIAAAVLMSTLLLAAVSIMAQLFLAGFLGALLLVAGQTGFSLSDVESVLLLSVMIGLVITATAVSLLYGMVADLRVGSPDVSEKSAKFWTERADPQNRLDNADERQREVERELSLAKEAAEHASMVKGAFLATMSHEIRTPLNGIVPLLEILRETRLDSEQRQFVNTALNSSYHLLGIINDILDFSKIEAGKLDLEAIELDLREVVASVVAMMGKSAERRNLTLDYRIAPDVPLQVRGDPIRLRQILTNLVSNAIKFTARGGVKVDVSCRGGSDRQVEVVFAVRDSGAGISEAVQKRLFHPFNQADASTTRKHGGTGLGLVICKRLVDLMGGRIGVRSRVGKGSIFWFLVPMQRLHREEMVQEGDVAGQDPQYRRRGNQVVHADEQGDVWQDSTPLSGDVENVLTRIGRVRLMGRVLIVEDNLVNLNVAKKMLLRMGLTCEVARDGMQALEAYDGGGYDLLLMDCQMPNMDGYEATRVIRQREMERGLVRMPIIAMTANAMEGDRQRCLEAGMDDYLSKPLMPATLRLMLCQWLPQQVGGEVPVGVERKPEARDDAVSGGFCEEGHRRSAPVLVDMSVIDELREIMEDEFLSLIQDFLRTAPQQIDGIRAALHEEDCARLLLPAHSLKSASANVGANRLSVLARQLEQMARDGRLEAMPGLPGRLLEVWRETRQALEQLCEKGVA